jgi:hypothetical protein
MSDRRVLPSIRQTNRYTQLPTATQLHETTALAQHNWCSIRPSNYLILPLTTVSVLKTKALKFHATIPGCLHKTQRTTSCGREVLVTCSKQTTCFHTLCPIRRTASGMPHPRPFGSVGPLGYLHRRPRKKPFQDRPGRPMGTTCWAPTICLGYVMEARPTYKMHTCLAIRITRGVLVSIICLGGVTDTCNTVKTIACLTIRITVWCSLCSLSLHYLFGLCRHHLRPFKSVDLIGYSRHSLRSRLHYLFGLCHQHPRPLKYVDPPSDSHHSLCNRSG